MFSVLTVVLKSGPVRRVDSWPGRSGPGTGPGWRKNRKRKIPVWPGDPVRPGQKLGCNPLTFVLMTSFWFFLRIDPDDPVTRSKPDTRVLDRAGHWTGSTNYGFDTIVYFNRVWTQYYELKIEFNFVRTYFCFKINKK
jgi:hypothetical protein